MPVAPAKGLAPTGQVGQGPAMGSIAQSIYNQMSRAGQPRTTVTKVEEPIIDEPLNIGQLGLLFYALFGQSQYKPQGTAGADASATAGGAMPQNMSFSIPGLTTEQVSSLWNEFGGLKGK